MATFLSPSGRTWFRNGLHVDDALCYVYNSGTTIPRTPYSDVAASVPLSNPVPVDGYGAIPAIWVSGSADVRVRITDGSGLVLFDQSGFPGDVEETAAADSADLDATTVAATGDLKHRYGTGTLTGWVRSNGRTIGNGSSGGTERANDDTENLFTLLWDGDTALSVSGGRGASATADFAAGKTIALPDFRGRALVGMDGMGGATSNRLNAITFDGSGSAITLGSTGGSQTHALTEAQLPAHTHTGSSVAAAGGHTPAGTLDSQGAHTHTVNVTANVAGSGAGTAVYQTGSAAPITTSSNGAHTHTFTGTAVPDHAHTLTIAASGSNSAHPILQPSALVTIYIKL